MTSQGTRIVNVGCKNVETNDVTRGFDDTIALAGGVVTPGKVKGTTYTPNKTSRNGEIALNLSPRMPMFGNLVGADAQEFAFVYLGRDVLN